ncbi:MAG: DUF4058 family protein [Candidatus Saccharimonas sp.]|nr:DUF4058 family protein [Planctomycetaceae bacterium]
MPSPFPGMNPYLEQADAWHDFHERFLPTVCDLLEEQVGEQYIVKLDDTAYIHEIPENRPRFLARPDAFVATAYHHVQTGGQAAEWEADAGGVAVEEERILAPITVQLPATDEERLTFIEIRDRRDRSIVTVIELLSPINKRPGPDREQYLAKRNNYFKAWIHFVEIDLLRDGPRMPFVTPDEKSLDCDYCVLVSRYKERPQAGLWPIRLREPLPIIPIPLKAPDPDVKLDLKRALDRVYDAASYRKYIYDFAPEPPLPEADAAWAESFLVPSK